MEEEDLKIDCLAPKVVLQRPLNNLVGDRQKLHRFHGIATNFVQHGSHLPLSNLPRLQHQMM